MPQMELSPEPLGGWQLATDCSPSARAAFASLDAVFALQGETVSSGPYNDTLRVEVGAECYFVKRYTRAGGPLRLLLGQPRVRDEWRNLRRFAQWGLAVAPVIASGMEKRCGLYRRGALITAAVEDSDDLITLARRDDPRLRDPHWLRPVVDQLAKMTRCMHVRGFAHGDLKWRNVLVSGVEQPRVVLIDCPAGRFWWGPFLRYRTAKDLATLDREARKHLSRSWRLRFYLAYRGKSRLDAADRRHLRRVLHFFDGRKT